MQRPGSRSSGGAATSRLRLLREMADDCRAVGGGRRGSPPRAYARAVEVVSRMGGITGDLPEEELEAMLDRGRALVPDDDKVDPRAAPARRGMDGVALSCRRGDGRPARAGLELARQTEDIPVLSSALDAVAALAWTEGQYGLAVGARQRAPRAARRGAEGERMRSRSSAATPST